MDESIVLAFDKTKSDLRKTWLLESTEKKSSELEVPYGNVERLGISDFIHKDLVNFSLADLKRSIAHVSECIYKESKVYGTSEDSYVNV